ncbi:hypothetical protein [Paenibacillus sp. GP183]|uniref:hypothetical protein n=1 Tax=Paenibacillus sp. GP183 TaxID=1882751 RepID=UPI00089A85DE|nr:hypothetical protein [Paenibacillus sp. GP183]SEC33630.1 hypothetical protein SAMN05443246_3753 [Paenibacillus sp. GP183]
MLSQGVRQMFQKHAHIKSKGKAKGCAHQEQGQKHARRGSLTSRARAHVCAGKARLLQEKGQKHAQQGSLTSRAKGTCMRRKARLLQE